MNLKVWLKAFRLRTLPLALSCIGMGGFLAASHNVFEVKVFLLCILTTIFLQVLSNLANDYGDSIHGADSEKRKGPSRAVQSGLISKASMKKAVIFFTMLSFISGITLLWVAFGFNIKAIIFFLALGIFCIIGAIAYTVGRKPYGYAGLGDLSVLVFFGLIGVLGSYYLLAHRIGTFYWLPALSCGFFSVGVLNINNIRDIESDVQAGKYSVPVRIGRRNAIVYHWGLLAAGLFCSIIFTIITYRSPWQFLFLLAAPLFIRNGLAVSQKPSSELDPYLRQMAISTLLFVILFGTGLLLS